MLDTINTTTHEPPLYFIVYRMANSAGGMIYYHACDLQRIPEYWYTARDPRERPNPILACYRHAYEAIAAARAINAYVMDNDGRIVWPQSQPEGDHHDD